MSVTVPEPVTASVPVAILLPVVETMRMWVVVTMLAVSVNFINYCWSSVRVCVVPIPVLVSVIVLVPVPVIVPVRAPVTSLLPVPLPKPWLMLAQMLVTVSVGCMYSM